VSKSLSYAVVCRVIANLCGVAAAFITIRLYNLYVSKEIYGSILVGLQIIGYLSFMSGGFRIVLNQQMLSQSDETKSREIARFGQTLQTYFFVFVVLLGMAVMAGYSQLPKTHALGIPTMVFVTAGIAAAITFQAGSQLALLVAFGEQVKSSLIQGAWAVVTAAILWISFALGSGIWAFPISNGLGSLLVVIMVSLALKQTKNDVPCFIWHRESDFVARLKAVWRRALDCLYNQVATMLAFTLDMIFVGILIGPGAAAVYGIVSRIMAISRQMLQSLSEAAWPRLTQELDDLRRAQMMRKVDRLNAWIVGSWYGAMAVTLHPFLTALVKPDWVAPPLLMLLILMRHGLISLCSPHAYGLMSLGRFRDLARLSWFEVTVDIVAGITLSLTAGVKGTAAAFLLGTCSMSAWRVTREYFRFAGDTHWLAEWCAVYGRALAAGLCAWVIASAIWHLEQSHFNLPSWTAILAGGIGFSLPVMAILAWWRGTSRIP
jgi:O-antigen/teichoic acid export membrane protein